VRQTGGLTHSWPIGLRAPSWWRRSQPADSQAGRLDFPTLRLAIGLLLLIAMGQLAIGTLIRAARNRSDR